ASVEFTPEAESAIQRVVNRLERNIRALAVDEAVRARGVPAEVTGSDVSKVSVTFDLLGAMRMAPRRETSKETGAEDLRSYFRALLTDTNRRASFNAQLLSKTYMVLGIALFIAGVVYVPFTKFIAELSSNAPLRRGSLIASVGLVIALLGSLSGLASEILLSRRHRRAQLEHDRIRSEE